MTELNYQDVLHDLFNYGVLDTAELIRQAREAEIPLADIGNKFEKLQDELDINPFGAEGINLLFHALYECVCEKTVNFMCLDAIETNKKYQADVDYFLDNVEFNTNAMCSSLDYNNTNRMLNNYPTAFTYFEQAANPWED